MKKIIPILVLSFVIQLSFAQQLQIPFDTTTGKISYTEIVHADSVSKKELFGRAIEWVTLNYKSANDVIQLKDEDRGKIIIKGIFKSTGNFGAMFTAIDVNVYHTIIIEVKRGRTKIQMKDFNWEYYVDGQTPEGSFEEVVTKLKNKKRWLGREQWLVFIADCDSKIRSTLDSYSTFIQKPISKKGDDW